MGKSFARGRVRWWALAVVLALALGLPVGAAGAQDPSMPWLNPSLSPDERVGLLLPQMTLDEKVDLMTGDAGLPGVVGFSNAAIPRLGIPALRMADAGSGLRRPAGTPAATAMPQPIALAATWEPEIGARYGRLVADEAFQLRNNVLLGPNADLARVPWWGRISESVGEDPVLAARMTEGIPAGVQRPGVLDTYKHPLLYNQETNRGKGQNSIVDERTIREVYAPPFDAAIKGGVGSVMCSFNKINGEYACESDSMQNQLLRQQLGFKGFIMSDYLANHSTSPQKGLDMETPGLPVQPTYYGPLLLQAVQNGSISMDVINQACTRILWAMFETGLFDNPLPATYQPIPYAEHSVVAREVEEQAITLLQNDRTQRPNGGLRPRVLPLNPDRVHSIAVIGADTDRPARLGGSAFVTIPSNSVGLLKGLTDRAPAGVEVRSAPGTDRIASGDGIFTGAQPLSSSVQSPPGSPGVPGVQTEFWANDSFSGAPIAARTEPDVTFNIFRFNVYADIVRQGPPGDTHSLRSTSVLTVPTTGDYSFTLSGWGEGRLWIDGVERLHLDSTGIQDSVSTTPVTLEAGSRHSIRVDYRATGTGRSGGLEIGAVQLGWNHPADAFSPDMQEAADLAQDSDVAVVFVRTVETEQQDSGILALPRDQATLIRAVAAANPNTVVVLGTGQPVLTPWASNVAAVVQSYFGGQEQGAALARVLFGDVDPSGKLPYTMARGESQYAEIGVDNPVATEANLDVHYREGRFLGYRGFDRVGLTPQFPFGHGLSYTTFRYGRANATPASTNGTRPIRVRLRLTNTGQRPGAEVAQVYLSSPRSDEPVRKLVGFAKVELRPGQSQNVTVTIDPADVTHPLSYWSPSANRWATARGTYTVSVGSSSRDLRQTDTFEVR
jgi:beta-glucosidase